jgi:hypothetical protein
MRLDLPPAGCSPLPTWMRGSGVRMEVARANLIEKRQIDKRWHASQTTEFRQPEYALHRRSEVAAKVRVLTS